MTIDATFEATVRGWIADDPDETTVARASELLDAALAGDSSA
ncbi:MAG: hypothetical protein RL441_1223, partial [Actinomycetota bacterium]